MSFLDGIQVIKRDLDGCLAFDRDGDRSLSRVT
jgi:hypothetical protein